MVHNATLAMRGWTFRQIATLQTHIDTLDWDGEFEYSDNSRSARVGNWTEEQEYKDAVARGCCGSYDTVIPCEDGDIMFGFNYGH